MKLLIIRHAQSANNALPDELRVEDPSITSLGHGQSAALATALESIELARLITSPFRRALETAEHLRRRLRIAACEIWVELHEQGGCYSGHEPENYRGRPGMSRATIAQNFPAYAIEDSLANEGWWWGKHYESADDAAKRARGLWRRILETFDTSRNDTIGLVTHGDFKTLFLAELARAGAWRAATWSGIWNTAVTWVSIDSGCPELIEFNSVSHLPRELQSH